MKFAFSSKTLWVNLAGLAAAVLTLPQLGAMVPAEWLPQIAGVVAALNLVLRWIGGDPLTFRTGGR